MFVRMFHDSDTTKLGKTTENDMEARWQSDDRGKWLFGVDNGWEVPSVDSNKHVRRRKRTFVVEREET